MRFIAPPRVAFRRCLVASLAVCGMALVVSCGDDSSDKSPMQVAEESSSSVDEVLLSSVNVEESSSSFENEGLSSSVESGASSSSEKSTVSSSGKNTESAEVYSCSVAEESSSSDKTDVSSNSEMPAESSSSEKVEESSSSEKPVESSSSAMSIYDAENNTLTDLRDNQVYKTVTIGERIWMAENLNYATIVISSDSTSFCYADNGITERGRENCSIFGRLYTWNAALDACPMGWHLPTKDEWETLFTEAGEKSFAGRTLKSQSGWCNNGNGTDAFGFSALPAGLRNNEGDFDFGVNYGGEMAYFWSSTEDSYSGAYHISFHFESDKVNITAVTDDDDFFLGPDERLNHNERLKKYAFSVRCIKDN